MPGRIAPKSAAVSQGPQTAGHPAPSGAVSHGPQAAGKRGASKRSKTGMAECSEAASQWQKAIKSGQRAPAAVYLKLAQCRAATRTSKAASKQARSGKISGHAAAGIQARQKKRVAGNLATTSARQDRLRELLAKRNARPISETDRARAAATVTRLTGNTETGPSAALQRLRAGKKPRADKQALAKLNERNKLPDVKTSQLPDHVRTAMGLDKPIGPGGLMAGYDRSAPAAPMDKTAALVARVRGSSGNATARLLADKNKRDATRRRSVLESQGRSAPAPHSMVGGRKATAPAAPAPAPTAPGYTETKSAINRVRVKMKEKAERTSGVQTLKTSDIKADPTRFQYKMNTHGPVGVTDQFKGTDTWNKELAGVIQVWKDPSNGQTYVVNGHHRFELAQRLGVGKLNVQYIKAKTDVEARMKGALTNIAEGRGTSVDAAKFFRDQPHVQDWNAELKARGISLKEKTAAEGLALKDLAAPVWRDVVNEIAPVSRGVAIGKAGLRHEDQIALYRKAQAGNWTSGKTSEFATEIKNSSLVKVKTGGLFDDAEEVNVFEHKAALADRFKTRLASDKNLFGKVARTRNAGRIEQVGANRIDVQASAARATDADNAIMTFDRERKYGGVVSRIMNKHAERIAKGEKLDKVYGDFEKQMGQALRMHNQGKFERRAARQQAAKEAPKPPAPAPKPEPIRRRLKDRKRFTGPKAPKKPESFGNGQLAPGRGTEERKQLAGQRLKQREFIKNGKNSFDKPFLDTGKTFGQAAKIISKSQPHHGTNAYEIAGKMAARPMGWVDNVKSAIKIEKLNAQQRREENWKPNSKDIGIIQAISDKNQEGYTVYKQVQEKGPGISYITKESPAYTHLVKKGLVEIKTDSYGYSTPKLTEKGSRYVAKPKTITRRLKIRKQAAGQPSAAARLRAKRAPVSA